MNISVTSNRKKKVPNRSRRVKRSFEFSCTSGSSSVFKFPKYFRTRKVSWQDPLIFFESLAGCNPLVFLDSASHLSDSDRSIIAWNPYLWIRGKRGGLEVRAPFKDRWLTIQTNNPHDKFRDIFKQVQFALPKAARKDGVGAYGAYLYEAGECFEHLPRSKAREQVYFEFIFPQDILIFDHQLRTIKHHFFSFLKNENSKESPLVIKKAATLPKAIKKISNFKPQFTQKQFESIVKKAKAYIAAGDIYQANLSQDFNFKFTGSSMELYKKLREVNPSPYSSFMRLGKTSVISSSPELLAQKEKDYCFTRPIAGTRPRGRDRKKDKKMSRSLLLSSKERAEHLMLLDLERNDLGRVCRYGSVRVEEQMVLEHYSHVIHIVSQVGGKMLSNKSMFDLVPALFPGGTITGCPKIRSMEIIYELEQSPRDFYTGSLGFLSFSGEMVLNIIIRTIVLNGSSGSLRVGAGIVADSNPAREYWETIQKGKAMFKALGIKIPSAGAKG